MPPRSHESLDKYYERVGNEAILILRSVHFKFHPSHSTAVAAWKEFKQEEIFEAQDPHKNALQISGMIKKEFPEESYNLKSIAKSYTYGIGE